MHASLPTLRTIDIVRSWGRRRLDAAQLNLLLGGGIKRDVRITENGSDRVIEIRGKTGVFQLAQSSQHAVPRGNAWRYSNISRNTLAVFNSAPLSVIARLDRAIQ